jgi:hypothetical protein
MLDIHITCYNQQNNEKTIATIMPDGVQIWCRYCVSAHMISKDTCMRTWLQGGYYRVTCSRINKRNSRGEDKLIAKIVSRTDAILEWCRYCEVAHRITREQCMQVWNAAIEEKSDVSG